MSIVYIVSDAHVDTVNAFANFYGYGQGNLSVKLVDSNSAVFWGAHTYEPLFNHPMPEEIPNAAEAIAALYTRHVEGAEPMDNWNAALNELGLQVPSLLG